MRARLEKIASLIKRETGGQKGKGNGEGKLHQITPERMRGGGRDSVTGTPVPETPPLASPLASGLSLLIWELRRLVVAAARCHKTFVGRETI